MSGLSPEAASSGYSPEVDSRELFAQYFQEELSLVVSALTSSEELDHQAVQAAVLEQADQLLDDYTEARAQAVVKWSAWFTRFNGDKMSESDRFWVQNNAYNIGTEHGSGLEAAKGIWVKIIGTDELPWPQSE